MNRDLHFSYWPPRPTLVHSVASWSKPWKDHSRQKRDFQRLSPSKKSFAGNTFECLQGKILSHCERDYYVTLTTPCRSQIELLMSRKWLEFGIEIAFDSKLYFELFESIDVNFSTHYSFSSSWPKPPIILVSMVFRTCLRINLHFTANLIQVLMVRCIAALELLTMTLSPPSKASTSPLPTTMSTRRSF